MLTKEFAQRVELSEKQVRKIVQHLEERGYQLSKTEYRGREATDFKEEDIELFKDIADKVKQTNSYDLAFDELEKEKDFLQVIVKNDDKNLPTSRRFTPRNPENARRTSPTWSNDESSTSATTRIKRTSKSTYI